jgi:chromosome segregation ATPase
LKQFSTLFFVLLSLAQQSTAAPIFSSKNWSLDDQGNYCVASTSIKLNNETLRLEATLSKAGDTPVEFYVRAPSTLTTAVAFTAPLDERRIIIYSFAKHPTSDGSLLFWMIPRATDSFVTFLRQAELLPMKMLEATQAKTFSFSLSGSTAVLEKLMDLCHPKKNIDILDFEKGFLPNIVTSVDVRKISEELSLALRTAFVSGYQAFQNKQGLESKLATLRNDFSKQNKELSEVLKTLERLEKKELPPLTGKRAELEGKIATGEGQIKSKEQAIEQQKLLRAPAQDELTATEAVLAPLRPEFDRRSQLVQSARRSLDQAQNRLSEIDSAISILESEIRSLNNELSSLRNSISSKQSELSNAESDYREAQRENDRFNESQETQDRLRRDSSYSNTQNEISRIERELHHKQGEKGRLSREVSQKRDELRRCQSQSGADCSNQQNQLNRAESDLRSLESDISSLDWTLRNKQNDLRRIEDRVSEEIRNLKRRLQEKEAETQELVAKIQSQIRDFESRASNISQISIPTRQNELSGLRSERPAVNQEIRSAQNDLSQRQSELETWKRSVDFDTKWNSYSKAKSKVDAIDASIIQLQREIRKIQESLTSLRAELAKVIGNQEKVKLEITKLQARKLELEAALAAFNQEQLRLTNEIQTATSMLAQYKQDFLNALSK